MRRSACLLVLVALALACSESPESRPENEPGQKVYPIRGRIEGRDARDNAIRLNHEAIPGFMEAMTMDFTVRGSEVTSLPPDGSLIEAQLHVTDRAYWLTDVKSR